MTNKVNLPYSGADIAKDMPLPVQKPSVDLGSNPSPMPLYRQVKQHLLRRVEAGEWKPGESLPSEMKLAEEYGLSQGTVRKAIEEMSSEGLVSRQSGRGTFVSSHSSTRRPFRFHRLLSKSGEKIAGDNVDFVTSQSQTIAAQAAQATGLAPDTRGVETLRSRRFDGKPVLLERIFLPSATLPGLSERLTQEKPASIYLFLERNYNILVTRVEEKLRARMPDAAEAGMLGLAAGVPVLEIERVAFSLGGAAVEWRITVCETSDIYYGCSSD